MRTLLAIVLLGTIAPALAQFDSAEYDKAANTILCDCGCHPQTVADCACGRAAELRREMRGMVESGMTGDEVIAHYIKIHGEQIRVAPTATGFNLVAWLGPLFALGLALGLMGLLVRRWRGQSASRERPEVAALASDDPYLHRLQQDLKELE